VRRDLAAAALAAALGCKSTPAPAPVAPPAAAAPVADAGVARRPEDAAARAAWEARDVDPGALDRAILLYEAAALVSADPGPLWLGAARARRTRLERLVQAVEGSLAAIAEDAQLCAVEARRSWSAQFPAAAAGPEHFGEIGEAGAEALYLDAVCTAAWARSQGFTPLIDRRAELTAAFSRVAQLAPAMDGAGAERELGILYAALPAYAGGDLLKARQHFDAAIAAAPREPRNHVALARTVAVKAQDRALFERELRSALASDDRVAAAQAASLLQREDDLFGPAEAAQPTPGGTQK
jgi:hypothetical protein